MARTPSQLRMRTATPGDAPRIAEIHMAAFGSNAMLHAQFRAPVIRRGLQISIENKALADIEDPKVTVLVVTYCDGHQSDSDIVIAFAKWSHPISPGENYDEPPWIWPDGTDLDTLDAWTRLTTEIESNIMGNNPRYRLTFIGTDPAYGRRGAGCLLVQWGVKQANASGSSLYLESTVEAAPLYKKNGFNQGMEISLPICLIGKDGQSTAHLYKEIAFTYVPPCAANTALP